MTHAMIHKGFTLRAEGGTGRTLRFTISTGDEDRMGDTIAPAGWQLADWRANPIILFGHDHSIPAIARGIAIGVEGGALKSTAEFPPEGMHPLADTVYNLAKSGFLTSASVGFIPLQWAFNDRGGRDFTEQRLMEWSIVNIPALPQAQLEASLAATAAVAKWLGRPSAPAGRGAADASILELDDEDIGLSEADVLDAIKALVPELAAQAVARAQGRVLDPEIDLGAIGDDFDPTQHETDRAALVAAIGVAIPELVRETVNRLRGRVD